MSYRPKYTRSQKLFLHAFRENPAGPPPSQWPNPRTLQRWLQRDDFRNALNQYRDTMRFQADFHIAAAATAAAKSIHSAVTEPAPAPSADPSAPQFAPPDLTRQLKSLTDLLRLSHVRQRFTAQTADDSDDQDFEGHQPQPGITWHDRPHTIANIFCDPDKDRLKAYMLLLTSYGVEGYERFLGAYPEQLARAQASGAERRQRESST